MFSLKKRFSIEPETLFYICRNLFWEWLSKKLFLVFTVNTFFMNSKLFVIIITLIQNKDSVKKNVELTILIFRINIKFSCINKHCDGYWQYKKVQKSLTTRLPVSLFSCKQKDYLLYKKSNLKGLLDLC